MALRVRRDLVDTSAVKIDPIVWALAAAAGVELAILRTFTRTAVHIPGIEAMRRPYELLTRGGEFAYFLTICLLLPVAVALLFALYRARHPQRRLATFGLAMFALPWPLLDMHAISTRMMDGLTIASVLAIGMAIVLVSRPRAWAPVAAFTLAFTASALYTASMTSGGEPGFGQPRMLLNGAELLGIAYACTTPLLVDRSRDRVAVGLGIAAGMLVFVGMIGNGSTSRFLLLWNAGLSGTLPSFFYAVAAGALAYTMLRAARSGAPLVSAGLILMVAGGLGLHSTYQSALVVAGFASLAVGLWGPRELPMPDVAPVMPAAVTA
jgi:hypothetical protein